jgi:predicted Ser/Thr protein kinase
MYDDRGLDIVGINKKTLEPYYKKYNTWLLDYDRGKMDKIFE